jgi:hypothetical protein
MTDPLPTEWWHYVDGQFVRREFTLLVDEDGQDDNEAMGLEAYETTWGSSDSNFYVEIRMTKRDSKTVYAIANIWDQFSGTTVVIPTANDFVAFMKTVRPLIEMARDDAIRNNYSYSANKIRDQLRKHAISYENPVPHAEWSSLTDLLTLPDELLVKYHWIEKPRIRALAEIAETLTEIKWAIHNKGEEISMALSGGRNETGTTISAEETEEAVKDGTKRALQELAEEASDE